MAVTDQNGVITTKYNYSPYGELIEGEYDENIQFLYNGQYGVVTDGNGLYYMRARYYNVDIKRFINQDVLTGTLERISSLNRYSYVEGNPVSYLDPFGLELCLNDDTQKVHETISNIAYVVAWIDIGFPNPVTATAGNVLGIVDISIYVYDLSEYDRNSNEELYAWTSIGKNALGLIPVVGKYFTVVIFLMDKHKQGEI